MNKPGQREDDVDIFVGTNRDTVQSDESDELRTVGEALRVATGPSIITGPVHRPASDGTITQDPTDQQWVVGLRCPNTILGLICGREQRIVKQLVQDHPGLSFELHKGRRLSREELSSVSFEVWLDNKMTTIALVHPDRQQLEGVASKVRAKVEDNFRKAPYTHFVCLPILADDNSGVKNALERFREEVLKTHTLENDFVDESILVTPYQLHFTLMMLRIYDQEALDKVDRVLQNLVERLKTSKPAVFPLTVHLKGVKTFDNERVKKASIVFTHAGSPTLNETNEDTSPMAAASPSPTAAEPPQSGVGPSGQFTGDMKRLVLRDLENLTRNCGSFQMRLGRSLKTLEDAGVTNSASVQFLQGELKKSPDTAAHLEQLFKDIRAMTPSSPPTKSSLPRNKAGKDISSVTGEKAQAIFEIFEQLVQLMTEQELLNEASKVERRIIARKDDPSRLEPTSVYLHVTLVNNKWRSPQALRQIAEKRHGDVEKLKIDRFHRKLNVPFDATKMLDLNREFGDAVLTQLHLSRCGVPPPGEFYFAEKIYRFD